MVTCRYALVAYVADAVGVFVERLRKELHPELPHLPAHLTVLPPRTLPNGPEAARQAVESVCSHLEPFEVTLGEVETFIPVTPTVFIRVAHAQQICQLHRSLIATSALDAHEEWSYLPHMTIAKMSSEAQAQAAYLTARRRWAEFSGNRSVLVKELVFVREEETNCWLDVAGIPLGPRLASSRK